MKRFTIIAALLLSVCCAARPALRVVSYNIRMGVAKEKNPINDWENRKPATPAMLKDIAPDVFGVQEAYRFQIDFILDECPRYAAVGVGRDDGIDGGEHMSIFYDKEKIELLDWGTYWLSETPDVPSQGWDAACRRTATWAKMRLRKGGREFFYVNTHLDHKGKVARKKGLELVVDRIADMNPDGLPMILTGDLNIRPEDETIVWMNGVMDNARLCAKSSDTKASFNAWGAREAVIDYIFYKGFSKCTAFKVIDKPYSAVPFISDHFPVYADLKF